MILHLRRLSFQELDGSPDIIPASIHYPPETLTKTTTSFSSFSSTGNHLTLYLVARRAYWASCRGHPIATISSSLTAMVR